jgi:DNA/RNA-binding domain of Phe-tRNA-synthetase-like protein
MSQSGEITVRVEVPGISAGWAVARGCSAGPSSAALIEEVKRAVDGALRAKDSPESAARKAAARDMLRFGAYKPTGRGKPASEYLLNAAAEGDFPVINGLVDINNLVSVESLLPISVVDLKLAGSTGYAVRRGREGEEYVFNPSGQVLTLRDLLLLARLPEDLPCASPIKDSQATKTHGGTRDVLGVIYAPDSLREAALRAARRMAELMEAHCGAETTSFGISFKP